MILFVIQLNHLSRLLIMKYLYYLTPFLLCFTAYPFYGIYIASAIGLSTLILQLICRFITGKKIEAKQWMALGVITLVAAGALLANPLMLNKLWVSCEDGCSIMTLLFFG
jgi:intracellular septation protein A